MPTQNMPSNINFIHHSGFSLYLFKFKQVILHMYKTYSCSHYRILKLLFIFAYKKDHSACAKIAIFLSFTEGFFSIKAEECQDKNRRIAAPPTLESGINKKNKRSPIYTLCLYYLNRLYEVWNKAVAPGKKSKN